LSINVLSTSVVIIVETCAESGRAAICAVTVAAKFASSFNAAANSFRVSKDAGAASITLATPVLTSVVTSAESSTLGVFVKLL